ncbi:hypothetical protein PIB30_083658 [Stylosanthes scabra]|uniref:Uncharacterized protein n=1 Tax=Stylosanthes scabra TaxID=79078 RepID=A0ABU6QRW6_9FABA|nr:hypothetical protein [Stylosanthes scabra]
MKKKVKIRNQGKESSKEESKEEKGKRRTELKCNSVEDMIGKLLTFKKVLHSNHLVKDQSNYRSYRAAAPLFQLARKPRTPARWPWRVRVVSLATFGRSYQLAWRCRAPSWRARTAHAFARWPWCVRALTLGTLEKGPGRVARPRALDGVPTRAHYHTFLGPHCMARPRPRHGTPAQWRLHPKYEQHTLFLIRTLNFSLLLQFSPFQIPQSHTPTLIDHLCV